MNQSLLSGFLLPAFSLLHREVVRFLRQRSRLVGALGTPLVFWLLLGSGFGRSFRPGQGSPVSGYLEYFFPGTLLMIVLFTSIFSNIGIIEERREGFLLSVLVAPVSRVSLVLGKVLGVTALSIFQGGLFLIMAPLIGIRLGAFQLLALLGILGLIGFTLTSLGFAFAWKLDSIQGFHAVMNLMLIPMWLLSGAVFPAGGASKWIRLIMLINPMTYGLTAIRQVLYSGSTAPAAEICSFSTAMWVTSGFGCMMFLASVLLASRRTL